MNKIALGIGYVVSRTVDYFLRNWLGIIALVLGALSVRELWMIGQRYFDYTEAMYNIASQLLKLAYASKGTIL